MPNFRRPNGRSCLPSNRRNFASLAMTAASRVAWKNLRRPHYRLAPARPVRLYRVGALPIRKQQRPDLRRRLRRAEQVALHFRTAELAQQIALLLGLDAFGRRG